ncbi:hypothetical protein DL89DRAFT_320569 [Linderina pennispora]|uniref:Uncharacterized protein n=1 Tax=Linderina pennispora TaxID=61395 RepID=A0A1Y1WHE5_9FUNG|nr:uncharacterized protein DL89DRAFT_320569 [Linderina pennispora]ORX72805.1 hypothetical protein DL89DRAFT_320569 [Linderina pennispora]
MDTAYIDDPLELVKQKATTSAALFPAAASAIDGLYRTGGSSKGQGIQIVTTTDSKCLRSWTFPPSVRFACPAKYYGKSGSDSLVYVALHAGDEIGPDEQGCVVWRWTDKGIESVGLEEKISHTLPRSVFGLEPNITRDGHLLAIHTDGTMALFQGSVADKDAQVVWYQMVAEWVSGDYRLVVALVRAPDSEIEAAFSYYVSLVVIDGAERTIAEVGTTRINPKFVPTQPLACAYDAEIGSLALLSASGVFSQLSLSLGSSALDDAILLQARKEVLLRGFVPCGKTASDEDVPMTNMLVNSQVSLVSLTEKYVAIVGTHSVMSHNAKSPYAAVLTLWDLQYGCLHAEQALSVNQAFLGNKGDSVPRLVYQTQPLSARLTETGLPSDQISVAMPSRQGTKPASRSKRSLALANSSVAWDVSTFATSMFLPPVTLLASLRLQNNPKYFVDPEQQTRSASNVHSSNILLHEEQEQGLGVLRSGWEAIVDGTAKVSGSHAQAIERALDQITDRRLTTQQKENDVLLKLASVADDIDSDQYTQLFMGHLGVAANGSVNSQAPTWISAHLMTTVMRRCFAEPLGALRAARRPVFAPRVIELMLVNCGLANAHAPAPGLLPHLTARVDAENTKILTQSDAWDLVNIALRRCPDLPEGQVIGVLQFQLDHYTQYLPQLFVSSEDAQMDDDLKRIENDIALVVAAIVEILGDHDALRTALAELSMDHVACIVRLLVVWMDSWTKLGANVELAASSKFVSTTTVDRLRGLIDAADADEDSKLSPVAQTLSQASSQKPASLDGAGNGSKSLARELTRDWAPQLTLPESLVGVPELSRVVDFVSLFLDAHVRRILLTSDMHVLVEQLAVATSQALAVSEQLRVLAVGLLPFNIIWEDQQAERVAKDLELQRRELGLEEIGGVYWERVQKLERYRVEVMHW